MYADIDQTYCKLERDHRLVHTIVPLHLTNPTLKDYHCSTTKLQINNKANLVREKSKKKKIIMTFVH